MASSSTFGITDYFWRQDNSVIANSWAIAVHFARTLPGLLRHKCRSKERHNVQPIGDVEPQPGDPAVFRLDVRQRYHALRPGLSADRAATRVSRRRDGDAAGANLQGTSRSAALAEVAQRSARRGNPAHRLRLEHTGIRQGARSDQRRGVRRLSGLS